MSGTVWDPGEVHVGVGARVTESLLSATLSVLHLSPSQGIRRWLMDCPSHLHAGTMRRKYNQDFDAIYGVDTRRPQSDW